MSTLSRMEMSERMWDDGFTPNLPKETKNHLKSIWGDLDERWDLIDSGDMWDPIDSDWIRDNTLIPLLWKLYNFWKMTGHWHWHKESGYLLGEIMWLLILNKGIDENMYNSIFHTKEKGRKRTTFSKAKVKLVYSENGKCWLGKRQHPGDLGNIIENVDGGNIIRLSDKWKERLMKGY